MYDKASKQILIYFYCSQFGLSNVFLFVVVLNKINGCVAIPHYTTMRFSVNHSSVILLAPSRPRSLLESETLNEFLPVN